MRVDDIRHDRCLLCFSGQICVFEMFRVARIGELYVKYSPLFGIFDRNIQIGFL